MYPSYRWNRPCYGITDGKPHLRIENRYIPSGPTIRDEVANAALWFGIVCSLARDVEDDPSNTTRFLVLGNQETAPTGRDRTSIVMSAENKPGAVHALLTPIAESGVSMSRIESRPSRLGKQSGSALWEYVFFIDLEGHQADARVRGAIAALRARAPFLKVLGSYPMAVS